MSKISKIIDLKKIRKEKEKRKVEKFKQGYKSESEEYQELLALQEFALGGKEPILTESAFEKLQKKIYRRNHIIKMLGILIVILTLITAWSFETKDIYASVSINNIGENKTISKEEFESRLYKFCYDEKDNIIKFLDMTATNYEIEKIKATITIEFEKFKEHFKIIIIEDIQQIEIEEKGSL